MKIKEIKSQSRREILFKGKVKYNGNYFISGDWVEGSLIIKASSTFIYVIELDAFGNIIREIEVEVVPETICQFTGLTDIDKVKIFEGDILSIKEFWNNGISSEERDVFELDELKGVLRKEYISDVIVEDGCFVVKTTDDFYDTFIVVLAGNQKHSQPIFESKIIGNIHDNPKFVQS